MRHSSLTSYRQPTKIRVTSMTHKGKGNKTITEVREGSQLAITQATQKEEQFTTAEGKGLVITEKFKDWFTLYLDKSKPKTYGNATQCALAVYDTESYWSAARIGGENSKKLKNIAVLILENEGFGLADLMKIGTKKMMEGSFSDWKSFMEMLGYFDPKGNNDKQTENTFNFDNLNVAIMRAREARGLKG